MQHVVIGWPPNPRTSLPDRPEASSAPDSTPTLSCVTLKAPATWASSWAIEPGQVPGQAGDRVLVRDHRHRVVVLDQRGSDQGQRDHLLVYAVCPGTRWCPCGVLVVYRIRPFPP